MIVISKDEAVALRAAVPDAQIIRTMKQRSKRGRYLCAKTQEQMSVLERLRGGGQPLGKNGGDN